MPIDPMTGEMLPYDDPAMGMAPPGMDPGMGMPMDPAMGAGPQLPSLDAGTLAQLAMQVIAQQADMDAEQFAMAQQQVMMQLPAMIQAIVEQLAAPPPETLDMAGGEQAAMMGAEGPDAMSPSEEDLIAMLMSQGAMG